VRGEFRVGRSECGCRGGYTWSKGGTPRPAGDVSASAGSEYASRSDPVVRLPRRRDRTARAGACADRRASLTRFSSSHDQDALVCTQGAVQPLDHANPASPSERGLGIRHHSTASTLHGDSGARHALRSRGLSGRVHPILQPGNLTWIGERSAIRVLPSDSPSDAAWTGY
jgi:hypothetical protein